MVDKEQLQLAADELFFVALYVWNKSRGFTEGVGMLYFHSPEARTKRRQRADRTSAGGLLGRKRAAEQRPVNKDTTLTAKEAQQVVLVGPRRRRGPKAETAA